jgi:CubicO group peptidase (beta-lactamase class C family)
MIAFRQLLPVLTLAIGIGANHFTLAANPTETDPKASAELAGLWKAKKRFGPDARGLLTIHRTGTTYTADMVGRLLPIRADKDEIAFDLPNREGRFRGKLDPKGRIVGHWLRFGTPVNNSQRTTPISASPVVLEADGSNRWRGMVMPVEDTFTLYLLVQTQADGTLRVVLGNPERDFGTQQGIDRLTREGNVVKLIGKWRGKEQEVSGTYDAENQVITFAFPNRGGNYDFYREGDESEFYPRGKNPGRYSYTLPQTHDDGWQVGTLEEANIDRAATEKLIQTILDRPMDSPDAPQLHGLLIARHGKLVLEEYFHGEHRDKLHNERSGSKSLTALIVGAAMQAGAPLKLSSPVYEVMNGRSFPADLDPQKRAMTIEHLLTMSAGYFCDDTNDEAPGNEDKMWNQEAVPDFYRYTMDVPMATPPGENAVYCSASANLALGMVGRTMGENPMSIFDRLVGGPMKIQRYEWNLDPAGNPYGGGGLMLRLRDYMKLGQLMLNGGTWGDRRILSQEFAAHATAPLYHLRNIYYGYLWWEEDYPYKDRTVHSFSARGNGGQTVTVIPDLDLVVATNAGSYASRKGMFAASTDPIPRSILPSVRESGDDKNAPVIEREYKSPYGASKDGSRVSKTK